jgi:hypothetical protein
MEDCNIFPLDHARQHPVVPYGFAWSGATNNFGIDALKMRRMEWFTGEQHQLYTIHLG